jgi:hypothetical protein
VTQECDKPLRDAGQSACPLRCPLRFGAGGDDRLGDRISTADHVDWAGLPINLDYAFSREQRDKVYAQHLMRKRWAQLSELLHDGAQLCVCEPAAMSLPGR